MKNLRNKNYPPSDLVQVHLESSYDVVRAVYDNLDIIEALGAALEAGDLDSFLAETDIDTLAKLNAILTDATLLNFDEVATAAQGAKVDLLTVTAPTDLDVIRARVAELDSAVILRGEWEANAGTFPGVIVMLPTAYIAQAGDSWIVSSAGTVDGVDFNVNDRIVAIVDAPSTTTYANNWIKLDYTDQVLSVAGLVGAIGAAALRTALNIEDGATGDLTGSEIKTLLFAEADTNNLTDILLTKLAGIETSATADQSDAEIAAGYNNQVAIVSQAEAEAGTLTDVRRWTPERVKQAIAALGGAGGLSAMYIDNTYTASAGDYIMADTAANGIWTLTLPATPTLNDLVIVRDCTGNCGTAKIIIDGDSGDTIRGELTFELNHNFAEVVLIWDGTEWQVGLGGMFIQGPTEHMTFAMSDETGDLVAGTDLLTTRMPYKFYVTSVRAHVNTAPTGADIVVDVNADGITIFDTPKLTIDAGEKTSTTSVVTNPMGVSEVILDDDAELTFDLDQIGSTVPGKGLKVTIIGYRVQ